MRVINHHWSATKQRRHPQSAAETSRHPALSGDKNRQRDTPPGSRHKDTDQCPQAAMHPPVQHKCVSKTQYPPYGGEQIADAGIPCGATDRDLRGVYSDTTQLNWTQLNSNSTAWTTVDSVCRSWRHKQKHYWLGCTLFNWVSWVELSWVQLSWVVSL